MAGNVAYGYRFGPRVPVSMAVDSSAATLEVGHLVTLATAGYIKECASGDEPYGVVMERTTAPSADGDKSILIDISREAVYELPPDSGTVTQALVMTAKDVGGAQSCAIASSTDKSLEIVRVDTSANTVFARISPTFS